MSTVSELEQRTDALAASVGDELLAASERSIDAPAHAGVGLSRNYHPPMNAYNVGADALRKSRMALARAIEGSGRFSMLCMGDSSLVGANGGGIVERWSVAKQIARCLSEMTGAPLDTGFTTVPFGIGSPSDRITTTGTVNHNSPFATISAAATWTYTTEDAGDEVVIVWSNLSGAWSYSVDGKTPVAVGAGTGTAVANVTTSAGHGDTTHTVTITPTAAGAVYILGIWIRRASGISVHNWGFGGSRSHGGAASGDWTTGSGNTSLTLCRQLVRDAAVVTPDLVLVSIGPNEMLNGATADASLAALETMLGWYPTAEKILVQNVFFEGTDATQRELYTKGKYDLADEYNAVLVDWRDLIVDVPTALAAGALGPDNLHFDYGLQRELGRQIAGIIAGPGPAGRGRPPQVTVHAPGATYTVKDSDNGRRIRFNHTAATAVTIPGDLPDGFECSWEQYGAGVPTFSTPVSLRSRGGANKSAGQYAVGGISKIDADEVLLYGDITT